MGQIISFESVWYCIVFVIIPSILCPLTAYAVPACDSLFELKQTSGISFEARQHGDEWYNWIETKEGYGIYKNPATGNWEYYISSDDAAKGVANGIFRLLGVSHAVVGEIDPASLHIPKGLRPPKTPSSEPHLFPMESLQKEFEGGLKNTAIRGTMHLLVIGVDYANAPATYTAGQIQQLLFGNSTSVFDYYNKTSYSSVTIVPAAESHSTPNDGFIGWLRLSGNHPNTGASTDNRNKQIAKDAIIAANPYIDYAQYDTNGNAIVESTELSIMIIVAGYEASYSGDKPSVWGHQWNMYIVGYPSVDGKTIQQYAQFGEKHGGHMATFGIMAHELGHLMFGLPDLYDTDTDNGDSAGVGYYDLMGSGSWGAVSGMYLGSSPTQLSAWCKEFLSWGTVNTIFSNQSISFSDTNGNNSSVFRINTADSNQYFLLENRQFNGYDRGFYSATNASGHGGLVIYHIDKLKTTPQNIYYNTVNSEENNKGVDVEEANEGSLGYSMLDTNTHRAHTNMFFFSGNNSSFTDTTLPNSRLKNGNATNISVMDISAYGDMMSAIVSLTAERPEVDFRINNGVSSTTSRAVTLNNTATGNPTEYIASELPDFADATWQTYSTEPDFTLSTGNGNKTVYFKVRNSSHVESVPVNDSITLESNVQQAFYTFDEGSGAIAGDSSGGGNHGTVNGATWTTGRNGGGLSFDGKDDYVDLGNPSSLQPSTISLSAWFKTTVSGKMIMRKRMYGYGLEVTSSGKIAFWIYNTSATKFTAASLNAYNDNAWHHAVGVYDGSTVKLYIDGYQVAAASAGTIYYGTGGIAIGRDGDYNGSYFNGLIDDVRIYGKILTDQEVLDLYTLYPPIPTPTPSPIPTPSSNLMAYYPFNEGSGTNVWDSSGNSNNGTINGAVWTTGKSGSALSFDGIDDYVYLGNPSSLQPTSVSLSAWYKTSVSGRMIMRKRMYGYGLEVTSSGKIAFWIYNATATKFMATSTNAYNDNAWHHAVGVYDGSIVKLYIDGSPVATAGAGTIYYEETGGISIGRDGDYSGSYFNGSIDEVSVYNRALSDQEIQGMYNTITETSTVASLDSPDMNRDTDNTYISPSTGITLRSFRAKACRDGRITLHWKTPSETDTAGFNLYRSRSKSGGYRKVNNVLIAAIDTDQPVKKYRFTDERDSSSRSYYYKLEQVDYYGETTRYGPIRVRLKSPGNE